MALALLMSLSVAASAVSITPRWNSTTSCIAQLTIAGTTATCTLDVSALSGSKLKANITLYRADGSKAATWLNRSGTSSLEFSETCAVSKGSYKLEAIVTVTGSGGSDSITKTATATCK